MRKDHKTTCWNLETNSTICKDVKGLGKINFAQSAPDKHHFTVLRFVLTKCMLEMLPGMDFLLISWK